MHAQSAPIVRELIAALSCVKRDYSIGCMPLLSLTLCHPRARRIALLQRTFRVRNVLDKDSVLIMLQEDATRRANGENPSQLVFQATPTQFERLLDDRASKVLGIFRQGNPKETLDNIQRCLEEISKELEELRKSDMILVAFEASDSHGEEKNVFEWKDPRLLD